MTFEPGPFAGLLVLAVLYVRAARVLARRGYHVPRGQQAYWWTGFACMTFALLGPLDSWADTYVSAHMAQHMVMADISVPLLLIGLRSPILMFYLPRAVLVPLARRRRDDGRPASGVRSIVATATNAATATNGNTSDR